MTEEKKKEKRTTAEVGEVSKEIFISVVNGIMEMTKLVATSAKITIDVTMLTERNRLVGNDIEDKSNSIIEIYFKDKEEIDAFIRNNK